MLGLWPQLLRTHRHSLRHRCQLPLLVSIADGNRHDSVHDLVTLYHARETFGFPLQAASLDAAHDALGFFRLATRRWHMTLVMPLNERREEPRRKPLVFRPRD